MPRRLVGRRVAAEFVTDGNVRELSCAPSRRTRHERRGTGLDDDGYSGLPHAEHPTIAAVTHQPDLDRQWAGIEPPVCAYVLLVIHQRPSMRATVK